MSTINLDQARSARAEQLGEAPSVTFGGSEFALPPELPFGVFVRLGEMQGNPAKSLEAMDVLLGALFGDRKDEFLSHNPSLEDVKLLMEGLFDVYGVSVGEASASPAS
jgi:hypothetical protein